MTDERERLLDAIDRSAPMVTLGRTALAEWILRQIEANCERVQEECAATCELVPSGGALDAATAILEIPITIRIKEEQGCSKPPP